MTTVPTHGSWIQTHLGHAFDLKTMDPAAISIYDIAHALAHSSRWNGHAREFFSIAQHSVLVSMLVEEMTDCPRLALAGLLHDATEAYLGDVAKPLKEMLKDYQAIEARLEEVIARYFGLTNTYPVEVKIADAVLLATEARDLFDTALWTPTHPPLNTRIKVCMTPREAHRYFLDRYFELKRMGV